MTVPYTFSNQSGPIPLSELDANFAAVGAAATVSYTPTSPLTSTNVQGALDQLAVRPSGATTAIAVSYTPTSPLTSTNVQGALDQLAAGVSPATNAASVSYTPAGTGAVVTNVQARLRQYVSVKDFGAVGNGVADDTAAIQLAFTYARTLLNPVVHFPAGTYLVASTTTLYNLSSGMEVYGDGMDATIIKWNASTSSVIALFTGDVYPNTIDSATIRDLAIRGNHDTSGYLEQQCYPILITGCNNLKIHRVKVTYSKTISIVTRSCFSVDVDGCIVQYSARDGINTADCNYVKITNNRIEFCDDDSIAGHTQTYGITDRGYVIANNIIRFSQGISLQGARIASITGNTLDFCVKHGINITSEPLTSVLTEGAASQHNVTIVGNSINNCFNRQYIDNLSQGGSYISMSGLAAQAGTLPVIPGRNNPSTGTITSPYPYLWTANNASTTQPIADNYNTVISGNTFTRDVYPTAHVSDYGCGVFYTRTGPVDPAVVAASYTVDGVNMNGGRVVNTQISNNVFMGIYSALTLSGTTQFVNGLFADNNISDVTWGMVVNGDNTQNQSLILRNNIFDIDPFLQSTNRGSSGNYLASGSPTALLLQNASGFSLDGNTFKNCCQISDYNLSSVDVLTSTKVHLMAPNFIECQPAATGFSTSNRGIGNVPNGTSFILRCVDCNPNSATYNTTLNNCPVSAWAKPSTGTYIYGHTVLNNSPVVLGPGGSQYIVFAWSRLTTGSANVLNTDWLEARTYTGT